MTSDERTPLQPARPQQQRTPSPALYGVPRDRDYSQLFNYSLDEEEARSIRIPRRLAFCLFTYAAVVTIALLAVLLALLLLTSDSIHAVADDPSPLPSGSDPFAPSHRLRYRANANPPPSSSTGAFLVLADVHLEPHYNGTEPQKANRVCRDAAHSEACAVTDWERSRSAPPSTRSRGSSASPFSFGRYGCDPPDAFLAAALTSLAPSLSASFGSLDFVLVAGDLAAHFIPCPLTLYHTIDRAVEIIANAFASTPVILTIGNTDVYPSDHLPSPSLAPSLSSVTLSTCGAQFKSLLSIMLRHGLLHADDREAIRTFCHGGYYSRVVADGRVRVLSLNTLVWARDYSDSTGELIEAEHWSVPTARRPWRDNSSTQPIELDASTLSFSFPTSYPSNVRLPPPLSCSSPSRVADPYEQFRYLRAQIGLASLSDPPQHIHIVGHQPPGVKPSDSPSTSWCPQYWRRFRGVVDKWPNVVQALMFGDFSQDVVRVLGGDSGKVAHVNPGLSPRKNVNPAARVYTFERSSGRLTDYHQLYVDLQAMGMRSAASTAAQRTAAASMGGEREPGVGWRWQYSAREYYGMAEYGAEGWTDVARRMLTDEALLERYATSINVWKAGDGDGHIAVCDMMEMDDDSNARCRRTGVVSALQLAGSAGDEQNAHALDGDEAG